MNWSRVKLWVLSGLVLGALMAVLSIYDMRHYEGDWTFPSTFDGTLIFVPNLVIMLIALSGIQIPNWPQPFFYLLTGFVNACSIGLLFFIFGTLIEIPLSYINKYRGPK